MPPLQCRRRTLRRAVTTVETAVVIGVCFTFLLGVFEYGRLIMMRNLMENAAREGARQAVAGTSSLTTANIVSTVTTYLAGQNLNNLNIQVYEADSNGNAVAGTSWFNAPFGTGIGVQIDADYAAMVPSFGVVPTSIHIKVKSVMQSEAS